jgi:chlorobactene glucosyltransferase
VPPLLALASLFVPLAPPTVLFSLGGYTLAVLMRILLTLACARSQRVLLLLSPLHPISIMLECLFLLNSIRWHYRKKGAMWKGRYYMQ